MSFWWQFVPLDWLKARLDSDEKATKRVAYFVLVGLDFSGFRFEEKERNGRN